MEKHAENYQMIRHFIVNFNTEKFQNGSLAETACKKVMDFTIRIDRENV